VLPISKMQSSIMPTMNDLRFISRNLLTIRNVFGRAQMMINKGIYFNGITS